MDNMNGKIRKNLGFIVDSESINDALFDMTVYFNLWEDTYGIEKKDFYSTIGHELEKFHFEILKKDFPKLNLPWCYCISLNINEFKIGMGKIDIYHERDKNINLINNISLLEDASTHDKIIVHTNNDFFPIVSYRVKQLTAEEFASQKGLAPASIRQYIRRGTLRSAQKVGGLWFVSSLAEITKKKYIIGGVYKVIAPICNIPKEYIFLKKPGIISIEIISNNSIKLTFSAFFGTEETLNLSELEIQQFEEFLLSNSAFFYESPLDFNCTIWTDYHMNPRNLITNGNSKNHLMCFSSPIQYFRMWDMPSDELISIIHTHSV